MIKTDNNQRLDSHAEEASVLAKIIVQQPAEYWEILLNENRIPAARIRRMEEALADEQISSREVVHTIEAPDNIANGLMVPKVAFRLSKSPSGVHLPPQPVGAQTIEILKEIGYTLDQISSMQIKGIINQ